ncbi:hypothetical protein CDAR_167801 [Caerostris darwini]|uniref:Uncharacterized protein n=1 Tax=Caerostris darwini TaxID=1538125 RepID=A0AAV4MYV5_9ARAC|nr:hypothetical protein CDAR_167801 [Caerostris darwini]
MFGMKILISEATKGRSKSSVLIFKDTPVLCGICALVVCLGKYKTFDCGFTQVYSYLRESIIKCLISPQTHGRNPGPNKSTRTKLLLSNKTKPRSLATRPFALGLNLNFRSKGPRDIPMANCPGGCRSRITCTTVHRPQPRVSDTNTL